MPGWLPWHLPGHGRGCSTSAGLRPSNVVLHKDHVLQACCCCCCCCCCCLKADVPQDNHAVGLSIADVTLLAV